MTSEAFIALAVVVFLFLLNGQFRGRQTPRIDSFLSIVFVVLIGLQFYWGGWRDGLFAVLVSFILALSLYPFARLLAAFIASRLK